jgi:hypothetical protein
MGLGVQGCDLAIRGGGLGVSSHRPRCLRDAAGRRSQRLGRLAQCGPVGAALSWGSEVRRLRIGLAKGGRPCRLHHDLLLRPGWLALGLVFHSLHGDEARKREGSGSVGRNVVLPRHDGSGQWRPEDCDRKLIVRARVRDGGDSLRSWAASSAPLSEGTGKGQKRSSGKRSPQASTNKSQSS